MKQSRGFSGVAQEPRASQLDALALFLLIVLLIGAAATAHCTTSVPYQEKQVVSDNWLPTQYIEGSIAAGDIHKVDGKEYTTLRIQPAHTPLLYSVDVTFCGNRAEDFYGMRGDVVISYSRTMHNRWCYDLYSVHHVTEEPLKEGQ